MFYIEYEQAYFKRQAIETKGVPGQVLGKRGAIVADLKVGTPPQTVTRLSSAVNAGRQVFFIYIFILIVR